MIERGVRKMAADAVETAMASLEADGWKGAPDARLTMMVFGNLCARIALRSMMGVEEEE